MKNKGYQRLRLNEREEISRCLAQGKSFREIAREISRHVSTVSREIRQAGMNKYTYRAARSDRRAIRNAGKRKSCKHKLGANRQLWEYVQEKLALRWSPEQIARSLKKLYPDVQAMQISHEAIYTYLYVLPRGELKKRLLKMLRRERKRRYKRKTVGRVERKLEDMISIEERPAEVADRTVPGHWEGDLLIGRNRQSALGSIVERTTRFVVLVPLQNKTAVEVRKSFAREMKSFPVQLKRTLTYDQGREMAEHKLFTRDTNMKVYFAHPASPWERGTNENTNGLIRQFFPKGTDFNKVTRKEVKSVQNMLNGRPRKTLNWENPREAIKQVLR
ncbi:MAG: IS30 family transposase [Candidatus Margulisiibacteriota bacterium]